MDRVGYPAFLRTNQVWRHWPAFSGSLAAFGSGLTRVRQRPNPAFCRPAWPTALTCRGGPGGRARGRPGGGLAAAAADVGDAPRLDRPGIDRGLLVGLADAVQIGEEQRPGAEEL